jgi:hypothetical protein
LIAKAPRPWIFERRTSYSSDLGGFTSFLLDFFVDFRTGVTMTG